MLSHSRELQVITMQEYNRKNGCNVVVHSQAVTALFWKLLNAKDPYNFEIDKSTYINLYVRVSKVWNKGAPTTNSLQQLCAFLSQYIPQVLLPNFAEQDAHALVQVWEKSNFTGITLYNMCILD